MKRAAQFVLAAITALALWGQNPLAFEVATIKLSPPHDGRMMMGFGGDPGRVILTNMSLKTMLSQAYNVKEYQIAGPDWLDNTRFDVNAKVPTGVSRDKAPEMLQTLLAERFKLAFHRETKDLSTYALVTAKGGLKAKPSVDSDTPPGLMFNNGRLNGRAVQMPFLCGFLTYFVGRPVVDMTGVKETVDFVLDWMPNEEERANQRAAINPALRAGVGRGGSRPGEEASDVQGVSVFTALQQIGLRLESRKGPVETSVIDRMEKTPTEN